MISAHDALQRLKDGNKRFISNVQIHEGTSFEKRRNELVDGQAPFAVILGCSDARVPAELVFDQGLGDLFVVRVAGNVAAPSQIGSVEFAVEVLGSRLVVVMGHSNCGAVAATIQKFENASVELTPSLMNLVERIQPSVEAVLARNAAYDSDALIAEVVKANIAATVATLLGESTVLNRFTQEEGLMILGAEYSLETGVVAFFQ
ncbi:MAG: carbonic anhydrase [Verrucomicrobia bacterium]|nr:carbonic anhydrase [Verrucomicrobiota bacterium]MDA1068458.1 carbonic anhydrase [Verrucomicrobiota bacterium]